MDADTFETIVGDVLDNLPLEFTRYLENIEVLVDDAPSRMQRESVGLRRDQTLYGLYHGVPLTERSSYALPILPDTITIFREPLVRDFPDEQSLRAQVRRTVLHEIAHVFGISDQRLIELQAY